MSELETWLESVGLGQHFETLARNDVDFDLLPHLTDDDLKELGLSVGHRRKLRLALEQGEFPARSERADGETMKAAAPMRPSAAERRQLTVMFVDLVDSTALSRTHDPEDLGAIIRAYQDACAGVLTRHEGYVARYMGDGILAYFGYPRAHEDEAQRAVRAGLAIIETVSALRPGPGLRLHTRIGVATGLVVVGETIGEAASREQVVLGETPNLAARLQAMASPDALIVSQRTRELAGHQFEYADLGTHSFKGFAQPERAYQVLGECAVETRFGARGGDQLLPLVGRAHELALLIHRWQRAVAGEGQAVVLTGEPGIGKSRLCEALFEALQGEPYTKLRYQCSSYHGGSTLWPVIRQLRAAAKIDSRANAGENLDKLEALLARAAENVRNVAPLLAALLDLELGDRYPAVEHPAPAQRARTLAALIEQLLGLAARRPVLALFEDIHWIDPTTLELLEHCLNDIQRARVMLLITSRPEGLPDLGEHSHLTRLALNRLDQASVEQLIAHVGLEDVSYSELRRQIVERSDGVPLFAEEMAKAVFDQPGDGRARVPHSLHDSLMARLDRAPAAKEIAQLASVVGREFDRRLLGAISEKSRSEIDAGLAELVAAGLVSRHRSSSESRFNFKHALLRDVAYESLLNARRRSLHGSVADHLREVEHDVATEVIAQHLTEAERFAEASGAWSRAGSEALDRSAMREAAASFERALDAIRRLPACSERASRELELLGPLGVAYINTRGPASREAERVHSEAVDLAASLNDSQSEFRAKWNLWRIHNARGDLDLAKSDASELLAYAAHSADRGFELQAHHAMWSSSFFLNDLEGVRRHVEKGLSYYDADRHGADAVRFGGHDAFECGMVQGGNVLLLMGYLDRAFEWNRLGLSHALALGHPQVVAHSQNWGLILLQLLGAYDELVARIDSIKPMVERYGLAIYYTEARMVEAWLAARMDGDRRAAQTIREHLDRRSSMGTGFCQTYFLMLAADAWLHLDQPRRALEQAEEGLKRAQSTNERLFVAELERLKGRCLLRTSGGGTDEAVAAFGRAMSVSRESGARLLELRATCDLAELFGERGRRSQAMELLAPICGSFTEGLDTSDLVNARALLGRLSELG